MKHISVVWFRFKYLWFKMHEKSCFLTWFERPSTVKTNSKNLVEKIIENIDKFHIQRTVIRDRWRYGKRVRELICAFCLESIFIYQIWHRHFHNVIYHVDMLCICTCYSFSHHNRCRWEIFSTKMSWLSFPFPILFTNTLIWQVK